MRVLPVLFSSFLVSAIASVSGCSGGGVSGDCQRICATVTACYGASSMAQQCTTSCLQRAGVDSDPATAAVVRGCADCVTSQTCGGLFTGACNAACPTGSFSLSPSDPPATSNAPCTYTFPLEASTGQVSCQWESSDYFCKCYEDGVEGRTFTSIDFCATSDTARATQVAKACHW